MVRNNGSSGISVSQVSQWSAYDDATQSGYLETASHTIPQAHWALYDRSSRPETNADQRIHQGEWELVQGQKEKKEKKDAYNVWPAGRILKAQRLAAYRTWRTAGCIPDKP